MRVDAGSEVTLNDSPTELRKPYAKPTIRRYESSSAPYAELIQILRSLHDQAERDLSLHPNDQDAGALERSLRHQIDDLVSSRGADAA